MPSRSARSTSQCGPNVTRRRLAAGLREQLGRPDRDVVGALAREDPQLGGEVVVHRAVPVEMVGLEVQQQRDVGRERHRVLELEGAGLADHGRVAVAPTVAGERADGEPDVAGDVDRPPRRAPDRAEQLGRRRLAVRAGHRDERALDEPPAELELAVDRHAAPARLGDHRRLARHARALDDGARAAAAPRARRPRSRPPSPVPRSASASGGCPESTHTTASPRPHSARAAAAPERASPPRATDRRESAGAVREITEPTLSRTDGSRMAEAQRGAEVLCWRHCPRPRGWPQAPRGAVPHRIDAR